MFQVRLIRGHPHDDRVFPNALHKFLHFGDEQPHIPFQKEVERLAREKESGREVLCPVALDGSWKNSPWPKRLMEPVREYNMLDFSNWRDARKFGSTFNKLIKGVELFYRS
jgi:hypothetical protein